MKIAIWSIIAFAILLVAYKIIRRKSTSYTVYMGDDITYKFLLSLDSNKDKYSALSRDEMRELLGWMHFAAVATYRNDEGTTFDAEYDAFWEHYRFLESLAQSRGIRAYTNDCPTGMRDQTFLEVIPRYLRSRSMSSKIAILDKPLMQYQSLIRDYEEIQFLCGAAETAHLTIFIKESGIKYRFLNIPFEDWKRWKSKPEYKGDK